MEELKYWNHNAVYYKWIKKQLIHSNRILDVGCGDGSLIRYLEDDSKILVGIDNDTLCLEKAEEQNKSLSSSFYCCNFEDFKSDVSFDAIVFVASIHHMDLLTAIRKAKAMLSKNGVLIIVGLAKPSNIMDYVNRRN